MMKKGIILILLLSVSFFGSDDSTNKEINFDLKSPNDVYNAVLFIERLIFYYPEIALNSQKIIENKKIQRFFEDLKQKHKSIDSIAKETDTLFSLNKKYHFTEVFDPLLGKSPKNFPYLNSGFLDTITTVIKNIKRNKSTLNIDVLDQRVIENLPNDLRTKAERDRNILLGKIQSDSLSGGHYVKYLRFFRCTRHYMLELIRSDSFDEKDILKIYVKSIAEENLVALLIDLKKTNTSLFESLFNENFKDDFEDFLSLHYCFMELYKLGQQKNNCSSLSYENYHKSRKEVLKRLITDIEDKFIDWFSGFYIEAEEEAKNQLRELKLNLYEILRKRGFVSSSDNSSYIDIFKENSKQNIWLRLKPKSEILSKELSQETEIRVDTEVSLVYKPDITDVVKEIVTDSLFKNKLSDKEKGSIIKHLNEVIVPIPLGMTMKNLGISKIKKKNKLKYSAYYSSKDLDPVNVSLSLTDTPLMPDIQFNKSEFSEIFENLRFNNNIGLKIKSIKLDKETWEPIFEITWTPPKFLRGLFKQQKDYDFIYKPINSNIKGDKILEELQKNLNNELCVKLNFLADKNMDYWETSLGVSGISKFKCNIQDHAIKGNFLFQIDELDMLCDKDQKFKLTYQYTANNKINLSYTLPEKSIDECLNKQLHEGLSNLIESFDFDLDEELETTLDNIVEYFTSSPLEFDLENSTVCTVLNFDLRDNHISKRICLNYKESIDDQLEKMLFEFLEDEVKTVLEDFLKDSANELINAFGVPIPCPQDEFSQIKFFGIQAKVRMNNCKTLRVQFPDINGTSEIKLKVENGKVILSTQKFTDELIDKILKTYFLNKIDKENFNSIVIRNKRIQEGQISGDFYLDLSEFENLNFLGTDVIKLGTLVINSEGKIKWNGSKILDAESLFLQEIEKRINTKLTELLKDQEITLPTKNAKCKIDTASIKLNKGSDSFINIMCFVNFKEPFQFELKLDVEVNINKGNISIKSSENEDPIKKVVGILKNNFLEYLSEDLCDGASVSICEPKFDDNSLTFTGKIKINIVEGLSLPAINFKITPDKFTYDLNPEITLPGAYPLGPLIVGIDPTLSYDYKNKKVTGKITLTVGAKDEAIATAKVVKFNFDTSLDVKKFERLDAEGNLVLLNYMPVYNGKGYIKFNKPEFDLQQRTTGKLDDFVSFRSKLNINGNVRKMSSSSSIELLGMSANIGIEGKILKNAFYIDGSGEIKIPIATLRGEIGTTYILGDPFSHVRNARAHISGDFNIGDIEISELRLKINSKNISVKVKALGASVSFNLPNIDSLTEEEILKRIIDFLPFLTPEEILDALKNLPNLRLDGLSLNFDDLPEENGNNGSGGSSSDEGNDDRNNSSIVDKKPRNFDVGNGTGTSSSNINSLELIEVKKVETIQERTSWNCCAKRGKIGSICLWTKKCYGWNTYKKEIVNYSKWPSKWSCLPNQFQNYFALIDNTIPDPITNVKVYDLVHSNLGMLIRDKKYSTLLLRSPINKQELLKNNTRLNLTNEIPKVINDEIDFFGNIAYNNNEVLAFISCNLPREDRDLYGSNGNYVALSDNKIPNDEQLICKDCISYNKHLELIIPEPSKQNLNIYKVFKKNEENELNKLYESLNRGLKDTIIDGVSQLQKMKESRIEYINEDILDANDVDQNDLIFLTNTGDLIIKKHKTSKLWTLKNNINNQNALNSHFEQTSKIKVNINPTFLNNELTRFLPSNLRNKTLVEKLNSFKKMSSVEISKYKSILDEIVSQAIIYGDANKSIDIKQEYEFKIWDNSKNRPSYYSYTFVEPDDGDNKLNLKKWSFKIPVSDLTDLIGIKNNLTNHKQLIDNNSSVYKNLIYFTADYDTIPRQLFYADSNEISYLIDNTVKNKNYHYKLINLKNGGYNINTNDQVNLVSFNRPVNGSIPDWYNSSILKEHKEFFKKLNAGIFNMSKGTVYLRKANNDKYAALLFTDGGISIVWEGSNIVYKREDLDTKKFMDYINENGTTLETDLLSSKDIFSPDNQEYLARLILSAFDSYDFYGQKRQLNLTSNLWSNVNPLAFFKN